MALVARKHGNAFEASAARTYWLAAQRASVRLVKPPGAASEPASGPCKKPEMVSNAITGSEKGKDSLDAPRPSAFFDYHDGELFRRRHKEVARGADYNREFGGILENDHRWI